MTTTTSSVVHSDFTLERVYPATPARVFAAFADPVKKRKWFGWDAEKQRGESVFEFRPGGREHLAGSFDGETVHSFDAVYQDIVLDERIVYTYDMHVNGSRMSISLATVELFPEGDGCRVVMTEQGVFLDSLDKVENRIQGTEELLDALGVSLSESA